MLAAWFSPSNPLIMLTEDGVVTDEIVLADTELGEVDERPLPSRCGVKYGLSV